MLRHGDERSLRFVDRDRIARAIDRIETVLEFRCDGSAAEPCHEQQKHSDGAGKDDQNGYRQVCQNLHLSFAATHAARNRKPIIERARLQRGIACPSPAPILRHSRNNVRDHAVEIEKTLARHERRFSRLADERGRGSLLSKGRRS